MQGKQFRLLAWILGELFHTLSVSPQATQSLKVSDPQLLTGIYSNLLPHKSVVKVIHYRLCSVQKLWSQHT